MMGKPLLLCIHILVVAGAATSAEDVPIKLHEEAERVTYKWSLADERRCWQMGDCHKMHKKPPKLKSSEKAFLQQKRACPSFGAEGLAEKYSEIFPSGNRNAASHLWANYILSRAESCFSHKDIQKLFTEFCPVSGSPLGEPMKDSTYKYSLARANGTGTALGVTFHCCWPCSCDTTDLLKVDTKTITDKSGDKKDYNFLVIGDPCRKSPKRCQKEAEFGCLPKEAPDVICESQQLKNAVLSDNGHIIIGMFRSADDFAGNYVDFLKQKDPDGNSLVDACNSRKEQGYNSGMGAIFQQVARLNPL